MNPNNNDGKKDEDSFWERLSKAIHELSPAGPFEYGPKTLPLPRIVARAIAGEEDSHSSPNTDRPNNQETAKSEPDKAEDQGKDVISEDIPSDHHEKLPD